MATILIVDDSPAQNAFMELLLSNAGHHVVCADTVNEARIICEHQAVDLSLAELLLFRNNGFEIAPELQKITGAPAVLMLSRRLEADLIWAQARQIKHFLYRPWDPALVLNLVNTLLSQAKSSVAVTGDQPQ
jgi:two-component system, OmpR family, phosphate regulon response regulator PhoB